MPQTEAIVKAQSSATSLGKEPKLMIEHLAAHVEKCKQAAIWAKEDIEVRLLDSLRRRKGEYDPAKLTAIRKLGSVETYNKHTGLKVRAAKSWIMDVILPAGDKPWGLDPTPIPDLPPAVEQEIIDDLQADLIRMAQNNSLIIFAAF